MKHVPVTEESVREFVARSDEIRDVSQSDWHEFINSHLFTYEPTTAAAPQSDEYLRYQFDLWKLVSGRLSYTPQECEQNDYVPEAANIRASYPFSSNSSTEVGNYFLAIANIFRHLELPPGASVVEFGVGYGHLTRMLANFGYKVTAVDIELRFLDLLGKLALPGSSDIRGINGSFSETQFEPETIDAFVFFECFHHCIDHALLLRKLRDALKIGGKILFAAEPFYDDWFPFPWGLRLDGHAVWAIRNFGWMELGFRKSYITNLLEDSGFTLEWSSIREIGAYGEMTVATRTA